jgi:hypothetical protein
MELIGLEKEDGDFWHEPIAFHKMKLSFHMKSMDRRLKIEKGIILKWTDQNSKPSLVCVRVGVMCEQEWCTGIGWAWQQ